MKLEARELAVPGRLAPLSFVVAPGALHAVRGANGSGKSTLLDAVLGLVPFRGGLTLEAASLGLVPQRLSPPAALALSVFDLLAASRTARPVALGLAPAVRRRCEALLQGAGLAGVGPRLFAALSGGEQKRVLLADALERAPELLLLDEPEAALDAASRRWLLDALAARRAAGGTTLWVTHDEAAARAHATAVTEVLAP